MDNEKSKTSKKNVTKKNTNKPSSKTMDISFFSSDIFLPPF